MSYNANPRNLSIGGGSSSHPQSFNTGADVRMSDNPGGGLLRVVTNSQLDEQERQAIEASRAAEDKHQQEQGIAAHIRTKFYEFRSARETRGISNRLLESLRTFRGEYPPEKLQEIKKFGGSTVYSRLVALKCRGATAMLRDIYLAGERPWFVMPTPKPTMPGDITTSMLELVNAEVQNAASAGQQIDQQQVSARIKQLTKAAEKAAIRQAEEEADKATQYLDDILVEGEFYDSLVEFLHNMTVFPYAFMKGPVVRMATDVRWENGTAVTKDIPKMYWTAPSPFDVYWQSGVRHYENGDIIEHIRLTRSELSSVLGIPGYNQKAVRGALAQYGNGGLADWLDFNASERAAMESREDPHFNQSDLIDTLEFHGRIQGQMLRDYGYSEEEVPDPDVDYFCTAWLINHYVIKVQLDPNPRKRHPYYMTSFEKIPGSTIGYGLPEMLSDIGDVANATLRALVNNLCLTGDTVLYRQPSRAKEAGASRMANRPRKDAEITLAQVVAQEGKGKPGNNGGRKPLWLRAMDEVTGELTANKVEKVWDNGIQDVFRITTKTGYTIKATATHRFYQEGAGWTRVHALSVGDHLAVNGTVLPLLRTCQDCGAELSKHPHARRCKSCAAKAPGSWNDRQAQAALENRDVNPTTARARKLVRVQLKLACEACGSDQRLHLHHIDKDPWNCAPANLKTLCEPCHNAWHVRHNHFGDAYKHTFVDFDAITSIEYVGRERTYCLTMQAPDHNFVANGLISGNSIASGPQVVVNDDRLSPNTDSDEMYPWKRWHTLNDPFGSTEPAVNFHQPQSNSQELLAVYNAMTVIADENSSIPRYMTGSERIGGAGRTASGLNMLMQNAGKVLQSVAANIDSDIFGPLLRKLYDTVLLTDSEGHLQGDEQIRVRGVVFANQRENERTRMLEFLQLTANPIDAQIVGVPGRAELLREIADRIGLQGAEIVPDKETLAAQQSAQVAQTGMPGGMPGGKPPAEAGAVDEGLKGAARGPSGNV